MAGQENPSHGLGPAPSAEERLAGEFYDLDFSVHRSRRYHEKLARFYASWRDRFRIVTACAGSGAFLLIVRDFQVAAEFVTAFVALWAVVDIIVGPDKKHDLHNELCKRFTGLAAKIQQVPNTKESLRELVAERLLIEQNEPPCKRFVDFEARNDECRARGFPPDDFVPLRRWQRELGYYGFQLGMGRIEEWRAARARAAAAS